MIHLNFGPDKPHEWVTEEEFKRRYPKLWAHIDAPRPFQEIGKEYWDLRREARITLREMSKKIGVPVSTLCDMEQGRTQFTEAIIKEYTQAFNRNVDKTPASG